MIAIVGGVLISRAAVRWFRRTRQACEFCGRKSGAPRAEAGRWATVAAYVAALIPALLWPLWAVALGLATWGYHLRRRPPCQICDDQPVGPAA